LDWNEIEIECIKVKKQNRGFIGQLWVKQARFSRKFVQSSCTAVYVSGGLFRRASFLTSTE